MTRDEVIKMARDAGFATGTRNFANGSDSFPWVMPVGNLCCLVELERLVQAAFNAGAAAEREECAKVCDEIGTAHHKAYKGKDPSREQDRFSKYVEGAYDGADECADAIRARKGGA